MGFNLGLAAYGYQGAQAEQDKIDADNFLAAQRANAVANMQEQQSLAPYRANAAALADAQVQSQRALLPGATDNAQATQQLQAANLASAQANQPIMAQTNANNAKAALDASTVTAANASDATSPTAMQVNHDANVLALQSKLAQFPQQRQAMQNEILGHAYAAGTSLNQPQDEAARSWQGVADSGLFPDLAGVKVGSVAKDGDNYVIKAQDGSVAKTIPIAQMRAAYQQTQPQKPLVTLSDGQNAYQQTPAGLVPLTHNVKSSSDASGSDALDRATTAIMAGNPKLSYAEARAQAKGNPIHDAQTTYNNDMRSRSADPAVRQAAVNDAWTLYGLKPPTLPGLQSAQSVPAGSPGLDSATAAKISSIIGK